MLNSHFAVRARGIESKLLSILSEHMNFTWSMAFPHKGTFGILQSDETLDGIIGEICKF